MPIQKGAGSWPWGSTCQRPVKCRQDFAHIVGRLTHIRCDQARRLVQGGHLIAARMQPAVGMLWVGGGAEPKSIWYGLSCAGVAFREIWPKPLHRE